jgi:ribosomal protein S18 acetylase RimI-like enzyme
MRDRFVVRVDEPLSDDELYLRGVETLLASWEQYARGASGAGLQRLAGVAAAVFPEEPERGVYNNALLELDLPAPERFDAVLAMEAAYEAAGVARFAAWVHESDAPMRSHLERRGYTIDEVTRAMGMALDVIRPPRPDIELGAADFSEHLRLAGLPSGFLRRIDPSAFHVLVARLRGEHVSTAIAFDFGGDCGIYNVGTLEPARRRGLAGALTAIHLHDARARGCRSASLQSTAMAEGVYGAAGFRDLGRILEYVPSAGNLNGNVMSERGDRAGDLLASARIDDRPIRPDGVPSQGDAPAGRLDDIGVDVSEHLAQRVVGVGSAGGRGRSRRVDPCDRLAVGAAVAHGPLEQVLERPGQRAGVFGRAQQERVGRSDVRAQVRHGGVHGLSLAVIVRVEMGQVRHASVERRGQAVAGELARRPEHRGVGRASAQAPGDQHQMGQSAHHDHAWV